MLSDAIKPPACPTPAEEIAAALDRIGPLQGLPLEDRLWLARHGEEYVANTGDVLFEEGAPPCSFRQHIRPLIWELALGCVQELCEKMTMGTGIQLILAADVPQWGNLVEQKPKNETEALVRAGRS